MGKKLLDPTGEEVSLEETAQNLRKHHKNLRSTLLEDLRIYDSVGADEGTDLTTFISGIPVNFEDGELLGGPSDAAVGDHRPRKRSHVLFVGEKSFF